MAVSNPRTDLSLFSILLVDDNADGSLVRKAVLEEVGYRVQTALNGAAALELMARTNFTVVVTDYQMPGMDGVALIKALRQEHPDLRIILLSGLTNTLGFTPENTGADVVLQKSANEISQLKRAVSKLIRKPAARYSAAGRGKRKAATQ